MTVAYKAEIDVKVRNLGSISQLEQKLSSISKSVNAINKKRLGGGASAGGGGSSSSRAVNKANQQETAFLRVKNSALALTNRALKVQNKLKDTSVDLTSKIADLEKIGDLKGAKNLNNLKGVIEKRKSEVILAEKSLISTKEKAKAEVQVAQAAERTLTAQQRINVLRLSGSANKLAGGMGGFIDSQRKGLGPSNLLGLPSSKDIEGRGIQRLGATPTIRDRAGEFTASSVEKAEFFEKRRNAAIERGIEANNKLIGSERIRNRQTISVNKAVEKNNRQTIRQSNNLRKLGDRFGQLGTNIAKFQDGLLKTRGPGGSMLALPSAQMLDQRVKATGQAGGFSRAIPRFRMPSPTRGFDFESALISGGFPLLFGQGPLTAAAGALGGGVGGMFGGMGGFAGGIAATAIVQTISSALDSISKLGQALGSFTQNTEAVTSALGLQGSVQEAQIKLIEQVEGKTAAFNAASKIMAAEIGTRGVDALKKFGENSRIFSSQLTLALTKLQAFTAGLINFIGKITGINNALKVADAGRIVKSEAALGDPEAKALQKRQDAIDKKTRGTSAFINPPTIEESLQLGVDQKRLNIEKQLFAIRKKVSAEVANETTKSSELLAAKEKEVDLNNRVKEIMKRGINKELAKSLATVEQTFDKEKEVLLEKQKQAKLDLATAQLDDASKPKQDELKEKLAQITKELGIHNAERLRALGLTEDLADGTDKVGEAFEKLNQTIRNDIKEGIKGLIKGTSTLGDLLNNVADRFLDLALNQALFGSAAGEFKKGKGGGIFGAIAGIFKANGGPVRSGRSFIVGEKGPELFTPGRSGAITPNHKLMGGGSTSVVVNVDASGSDVQGDDAGAKELGGLISVAVQSELVRQQRPGGLLSSIR